MIEVGPAEVPVRHRLRVTGVVQGVGFRPFLHRLAHQEGLAGFVGNDSGGVFAEVEGRSAAVARFEARLWAEAPPLARIDDVSCQDSTARGDRGFRIVDSCGEGPTATFVAPDMAVCADCLAELFDPADRRYRYPFINCTNCGPRFTIITRLPYDRPNTTMRSFALCPSCDKEYRDPANRRFHAQPVACAQCGPRVWFERGDGTAAPVAGTDPALRATQAALAQGEIVAVKGIGGFHLACDATSAGAVDRLRARKHRPAKALAVMVRDLAAAARVVHLDACESALLSSPQRPIVLLRRREGGPLPSNIAPGNPQVGLLLPYSPLHHLLLAPLPGGKDAPWALVMTSGNLADEPICYEDTDARRRLHHIADCWLFHNRPIHVPCDDSVIRVEGGRELPIRRSRGYAPLPVPLPFDVVPVLATGGEIKNTFCLASGRHAWMSQHIGDMGSVETLAAFERSTRQFEEMYRIAPRQVATDTHPGYQSRQWAVERGGPVSHDVQHHHAHVAAVMAEHQVPAGERVVGFAFDGTGYGPDGAIWGGEVLVAGYDSFERVGHLRYAPLPGGDSAIQKPYRAALAHLYAAGIDWSEDLPPVQAMAPGERAVLERQMERGVACVPTSSVGRLFDAVSSLVGIRHVVSFEAQAAIEAEAMAAASTAPPRTYRFELSDGIIDPGPVLRALVADLRAGHDPGSMSAGFHAALAEMLATTAESLCRRVGTDRVALSGGVFQNVLLVGLARAALTRRHLKVLTHRLVPPNDGGLALGQAAVAGYRSAR